MEYIRELVHRQIGKSRFEHTLRVVESAKELAAIYDVSEEKVEIAALLHDNAKSYGYLESLIKAKDFGIILDDMTLGNQQLIHSPLGAKLAEVEFGIEDDEIIDAISYHTTGKENMSVLCKIIYVADFIEPGRNFLGIDRIRSLAFTNLDLAVLEAMNSTIEHLLRNNKQIHLDTIRGRNFLIKTLGLERDNEESE